MSRVQFVSNRILLLLFFLVVLPVYGLYTDQVGFTLQSGMLGAILFVWKWRWWWEQIREYIKPDVNSPP